MDRARHRQQPADQLRRQLLARQRAPDRAGTGQTQHQATEQAEAPAQQRHRHGHAEAGQQRLEHDRIQRWRDRSDAELTNQLPTAAMQQPRQGDQQRQQHQGRQQQQQRRSRPHRGAASLP